MVSRRTMLAAGAGVAAGLTAAGCGRPARWAAAGSTGPGSAGAARVTVRPAADATGVSPTEAITVGTGAGTIQAVTVTGGSRAVAGTLAADQRSWRSTGPLEYSRTYTVTVTVVDRAGRPAEHTSHFQTLRPSAVAAVTYQANALRALKSGATYGVGQPVVVHFGKAVKDRAAAERAMSVSTEPAVEGRWRWIDNQTAHYRPARYWTPGTAITVAVDVLGVHLGNGVYGESNTSAQLRIGPSRIAIADADTHHMRVFIDGKLVRTIPVRHGKGGSVTGNRGQTIRYWTNNGPHVVLDRRPSVQMTSASYGITDPKSPNYYSEKVLLCCRISYSGEFVHLADWNIPQHGRANTSHGCINVGPANARWFYDTFGIGDVVEVRNSPVQLAFDNGLGDWTIPWDQW